MIFMMALLLVVVVLVVYLHNDGWLGDVSTWRTRLGAPSKMLWYGLALLIALPILWPLLFWMGSAYWTVAVWANSSSATSPVVVTPPPAAVPPEGAAPASVKVGALKKRFFTDGGPRAHGWQLRPLRINGGISGAESGNPATGGTDDFSYRLKLDGKGNGPLVFIGLSRMGMAGGNVQAYNPFRGSPQFYVQLGPFPSSSAYLFTTLNSRNSFQIAEDEDELLLVGVNKPERERDATFRPMIELVPPANACVLQTFKGSVPTDQPQIWGTLPNPDEQKFTLFVRFAYPEGDERAGQTLEDELMLNKPARLVKHRADGAGPSFAKAQVDGRAYYYHSDFRAKEEGIFEIFPPPLGRNVMVEVVLRFEL